MATGAGTRRTALLVVADARRRLAGRDLVLVAAGLTFFAAVSVVPLLLLAVWLTTVVTSADQVRELGAGLANALPGAVGAPSVVTRLVDTGTGLGPLGALAALLPVSFYGEGLRRALLRFRGSQESATGRRGRLRSVPLLVLTPALLLPVLLAAGRIGALQAAGGAPRAVAAVVLGYYTVLAVLLLPLAWVFRVVAAGALGWRALLVGTFLTAASLAGFLQGFVLFLALPFDLGLPFGGLTTVGGAVAVGLWLLALHLVLLLGWVGTAAYEEVGAARRADPPR